MKLAQYFRTGAKLDWRNEVYPSLIICLKGYICYFPNIVYVANNAQLLEAELAEHLIEDLRALPGLEVLNIGRGLVVDSRALDLVVDIRCKAYSTRLFIDVKGGKVTPSTALQVSECLASLGGAPMLAASSLSEATRELLRQNGVAYWDRGGSLYLELPQAVYVIEKPVPPQAREDREPKNPYRGSSAQVLHTMLLAPDRPWKVTELAQEAKVSPYTSQQVLGYLESQLWIRREGRGPQGVRYLTQPGKLLDAWANQHSWSSYRALRFHRLAKNIAMQREQLVSFLGSQETPWALTLEHGVQAIAPFVTQLPGVITAIVADSQPWISLAKKAGFKEVENGENLRLWLVSNETPFIGCREHEGLAIASPIQLYLDLFKWPRRGKEQAQHLRERVLSF